MKRWRWVDYREFANSSDWGFDARVGDGTEIDPDDDCGAGIPVAETADGYYDFAEVVWPEGNRVVWEQYVLEVRS